MRREWSIGAVIGLFSGFLVVLSVVTTSCALFGAAVSLNENQALYLFSTTSQVIAAVYGLTLTGFIFFRNELSREELEDETLVDAIDKLKSRYFVFLGFITALVFLTIFLSHAAISFEASGKNGINAFVFNVGQSSFITSLLAIAYFIFDVVHPKRIELASRSLQEKVDPERSTETRGGLEDFMRNFNQIEMLLVNAGRPFQEITSAPYPSKYPRRLSNARLAEVLLRNERIDFKLYKKLRELITLRNSIIHGADPVVSQEIVRLSEEVLGELQAALQKGPNQ